MPNLFVGVDGISRKITKLYCGVDGISRKITKLYCGVDGISRKLWSLGIPYGTFLIERRNRIGDTTNIKEMNSADGAILTSVSVASQMLFPNDRFNGHVEFAVPAFVAATENRFFMYNQEDGHLRDIDPRTGVIFRALNVGYIQCGFKGGVGGFIFANYSGPDVNADNQEKPPATTTPYRSILVAKHDDSALAHMATYRVHSPRAFHNINRHQNGCSNKMSGATGGAGSVLYVMLGGGYENDNDWRVYTTYKKIDHNSGGVIYQHGLIGSQSSTSIWPNYCSDGYVHEPGVALRAGYEGNELVGRAVNRINQSTEGVISGINIPYINNAVSVGNKY